MKVFVKENPVGVDIVINRIQLAVADSLTWVNYNAYHRIYKNETENGIIPELYKNITQRKIGEYEDVYLDDKLDATSFIYTEDNIPAIDGGRMFNTTVSMVFQVDLRAVGDVDDLRNDEEIHRDVILAINKTPDAKVVGLITGISSVYSIFDTTQVKWDDMQPFHCFRVDIEVNYQYNCDTKSVIKSPSPGVNLVII